MKSKSLKQYYKACLSKIGLANRGAFLMGLDTILTDDTFISSYPKSGNTWLRIIIANILFPNEDIYLKNIDDYIQGLYSATEKINAKKEKRFIKSHYPYFNYYPKTIYIYRDYRDVLVSYYHYQKDLKKFGGTFSQFIRNQKLLEEPYGLWQNHIKLALKQKSEQPQRILMFKYEDLHENIEECIKNLIEFLGAKHSVVISEVINKSAFDYLKKMENLHGSEYKKLTSNNFFREGKENIWQDYFNEDDLSYIFSGIEVKNTMKFLGYIN